MSLDVSAAERALGYVFSDKSLLVRALTHPSLANERPDLHPEDTNDRLEFLGDAVLGYIVSEELFSREKASGAGRLTALRRAAVSKQPLAGAVRKMGLRAFLMAGKSLGGQGAGAEEKLLSDIFEAVLAAVCLDGGMDAARRFVLKNLDLSGKKSGRPSTDSISELKELCDRSRCEPEYADRRISGENEPPLFESKVSVSGLGISGVGRGRSKRAARAEAAAAALQGFSDAPKRK